MDNEKLSPQEEVKNSITTKLGDFIRLIENSKYKVYTGWFKKVFYDILNLKNEDKLVVSELLDYCKGLLTYEDKATSEELLTYVKNNLKVELS